MVIHKVLQYSSRGHKMGAEFIEVLAVGEFANTETGSLKDSAAADIKSDGRIKIKYNGTVYYLPIYTTVV